MRITNCVFLAAVWIGYIQHLVSASNSSALTATDHTPICWTRRRPPPIITNIRTPRPQDIQEIIRLYNQEDPLRPPELATFCVRGSCDSSEVKFTLPMIKRHITCVASLAKRSSSRNRIAQEYMYKVTETLAHIEEVCSREPDWIGGIAVVNRDLAVAINGKKVTSLRGSDTSNTMGKIDAAGDLESEDLDDDEWDAIFGAIEPETAVVEVA